MSPRLLLSFALIAACACGGCSSTDAPDPDPPRHTPRWAFEPWISKDISTGDDTRAFVAGFRARDIPVGVVVLDSPWETNYNTYVPNPSRYPAFADMVRDLRADGVRVVLWTTQMMNTSSFDLEPGGDSYDLDPPEFLDGKARGFFVNDGETYFWWKGYGAGIDFTNPAARAWLHAMTDRVLDLGVSGWKLDFGEEYITTPTVKTAGGVVPHQSYSESYYRDFLAHAVARRGLEEVVTMVRPWDKSYQWEGRFYARPEHAPVAWVGDNRRDWFGLADALDEILRSARAGYVVIGSDIGGYLDLDDADLRTPIPANVETFICWTKMAAFTPFFQLHGRANLAPWTVAERVDETVAAYRFWATLHHELVPFFYSLAEEAYAGRATLLAPVGDEASWPGDYRFTVGEALLVAPQLDGTGARDVALPAGARWLPLFDRAADAVEGGTTLRAVDARDAQRVPVYLKEGAIVPMRVDSAVTGMAGPFAAGRDVVLVYPHGSATTRFALHSDDGGAPIELTAGPGPTVTLARAPRAALIALRGVATPAQVVVDGVEARRVGAPDALGDGPAWALDGRVVWVALPPSPSAVSVQLR